MNTFKKLIILLVIVFAGEFLVAQTIDTVRVMTYNLMFYRETTSFCNSTNNNTTTKDNAMKDIIDYALPDILVVNEMGGSSPINSFRLLTNALNQNGRTNYTLANNSGSGSNLVNMLFYDMNKFVLESQVTIDKDLSNNNLVRAIDVYNLRYNDPNLAMHLDTTKIHVIAAHLKAGSTSANENERADATEAVMAYLDTINATGNYIMAGDFNLYSSTEQAYQNMINYVDPTLRFFDPINVSGNWSNRAIYSFLHTQSTRTSGGCFAGGGMDDRFDFILASDEIMNETDKIKYVPNSYEALGQDGNRFNNTIISPTNNSVPTVVSQALYDMSDHLPVTLDLKITLPISTAVEEVNTINPLKFQNPTNGNLILDLRNQKEKLQSIEIYNLSGQLLFKKELGSESYLAVDVSFLTKGTYFIKAISKSYQQRVEKLIKI